MGGTDCLQMAYVGGMDESHLCGCDRPDESENPHRHTRDAACALWTSLKPTLMELADFRNRVIQYSHECAIMRVEPSTVGLARVVRGGR